ncbi:MAG TPA: hypothetical protein VJB08_02800 [Candidatus Nanoarchaeia archaeon]|nr:hypothetical protein [Candidatus Nanoarchaeia archaeon]
MGLLDVFRKRKAGDIPPPPPFLEPRMPSFEQRMPPISVPEFRTEFRPMGGIRDREQPREPVPAPIQGPSPHPEKPPSLPQIQVMNRPMAPPRFDQLQRPIVKHPLKPDFPEMSPVKPEIEQKEIEAKKREFERKMPQRPLFVRSDEYRTLLGNIQSIEEKVEEVEALSKRLNEIKLVRDKETQKWRSMLEDINKRLHKIDKVMEQ